MLILLMILIRVIDVAFSDTPTTGFDVISYEKFRRHIAFVKKYPCRTPQATLVPVHDALGGQMTTHQIYFPHATVLHSINTMKRPSFKYDGIVREWANTRNQPFRRPLVTSPASATSSAESNVLPLVQASEEMNIMKLASQHVNSTPIVTNPVPDKENPETSSSDSKRLKLIRSVHSIPSTTCTDYCDKQPRREDSSETFQTTWRKDDSSQPKGNHFALSKIVGYLQTRTLASYFKNPTKEDRMKITGLANVNKSLMAASVLHLGGKYDRHADSYLRGLRLGLSYASDRHEELEGGRGRGWGRRRRPVGRASFQQKGGRARPANRGEHTAVPRDLRAVYSRNRRSGGKRNKPRLSLSTWKEKRKFGIRQHGRDRAGVRKAGVQLCTFAELKQLQALDRFAPYSRTRVRAQDRRRSDTSANSKPRQRRKERRDGPPVVGGTDAASPRTSRKPKPKANRPKKKQKKKNVRSKRR